MISASFEQQRWEVTALFLSEEWPVLVMFLPQQTMETPFNFVVSKEWKICIKPTKELMKVIEICNIKTQNLVNDYTRE